MEVKNFTASSALSSNHRNGVIFCISLTLFLVWWVLPEFRNCGIHLIPRWRVRNKNIHLRVKPTRVIQAAGQDSDKLRIACFKFASRNSGTAFRTKTAFVFPARQARGEMITQLSAS